MACTLKGCKNRAAKKIPGITFHRFPKDQKTRDAWIKATGRKKWIPTKACRLCSEHFEKSQFVVYTSGRTYLKDGAVPTLLTADCFEKDPKRVCLVTNESTDPVETISLIVTPVVSPSNREIRHKTSDGITSPISILTDCFQKISKKSEEEASHNASYVLSNLTDGTASNLTEESASKTTQLRIIGVSPHKLTCAAKSKKDSVNASKMKTEKRKKFPYFRPILPKNAIGTTLITDNDGMDEEIPPLTEEQLNVEYIEVKPDIFPDLASDGFSETTQSPLAEVLPDFRDKVRSDICASDEETNFSSENEVLKLKLKELWANNEKLEKRLKESRMLCKLYAKENASLKEVIDNLRQIIAVSNDN